MNQPCPFLPQYQYTARCVLTLAWRFCILRLSTLVIVKGQKIAALCKHSSRTTLACITFNMFFGGCATRGSKGIPFHSCGKIRAMATARPTPDLQTTAPIPLRSFPTSSNTGPGLSLCQAALSPLPTRRTLLGCGFAAVLGTLLPCRRSSSALLPRPVDTGWIA